MRQKRLWIIGLLLIVVVLMTMALVACSKKDQACDHQWSEWIETRAATCTDAGEKTRACSRCGVTQTEGIAATGHEWGAWTVVTPATADTEGLEQRVCAHDPSHVETRKIDKIPDGHRHVFDRRNLDAKYLASEGSCTEKAKYYYSCACGEKGTETFDGDYKHVWNVAAATCTTPQKCTICGQIGEEQLAHKYLPSLEKSKAPSCGVTGLAVAVCSMCGAETREELPALAHRYGEWDVKEAATCDKKGMQEKVCSICNEKITEEIPTKEHTWNAETATCDTAKACTVCGTVAQAALGHDYQPNAEKSVAATCGIAGKNVRTCTKCGDDIEDEIPATGHHVSDGNWVQGDPVLVEGATCEYTTRKVSHCSVCQIEIVKEETAYIHTYSAGVVTKTATCKVAGEKTYTCTKCGDKQVEPYTDPNAHKYDNGVTKDGVTTYTCEYCQDKYTVLSHKEEVQATVDADALKDAGSIELKEAAITFDENAKDALTGDVEISASANDAESLGVSSDKVPAKATVYDITMTADGNQVSQLGGTVTVKVPYTLAEGEDSDNIAILYIDDKGELETIAAKYTEIGGVGYAIFETTHFSYYTVTLLTPAERCALYGHVDNTKTVAKTCTVDGYIYKVCRRCGRTEFEVPDELKATGHDLKETVVEATCTTAGRKTVKCANCNYGYAEAIPATGHSFEEETDKKIVASCTQAGKTFYKCANCDEAYFTIEAQLDHEFEDAAKEPTCTESGYTTHTCKNCQYTYRDGEVDALGHEYVSDATKSRAATCTETGVGIYKCSRCGDEYETVEPMRPHAFDASVVVPTCTEGGYTTYTCKNCQYTYRDNVTDALGHRYLDTVVEPTCTEAGYTLHTCSRCGDNYRDTIAAKGHTWDLEAPTCGKGQTCVVCGAAGQAATLNHTMVNGVCSVCGQGCDHTFTEVITAPTCVAKGYTTATCSKCGYSEKKDFTPATGEHTFENGVCTVCGAEEARATSYWLTVLKNLVKQPLYLHIDEMKMYGSLRSYYYGIDSYRKSFTVNGLEDAELFLRRNENGRFDGNVKGVVVIEETTYDLSGGVSAYYDRHTFTGVVQDNVFYFYLSSPDDGETQLMRLDAEAYLNRYADKLLPVDLDDPYDMVMTAIDFIEDDIMPLADEMPIATQNAIYRAIDAFFESFTVVTDVQGTKKIELDFDAFKDAVDFVRDHSIGEIFDAVCGDGAYDALENALLSAFDLTVKDVIDCLEEKGVDIDAAIDEFFDLYKDGVDKYNAGEIESVLDMIPPQIARMLPELPEKIDADEINEMILDFLKKVYENETIEGDDLPKYMKSLLKNGKFLSSKLTDVLVDFGFIPSGIVEDAKEMAEEMFEEYKDVKPLEMLGISSSKVDMVKEVIDNVKECTTVFMMTEKNGSILSATVEIDQVEEDMGVVARIELLSDYQLTGDYAGIVKQVESYTRNTDEIFAELLKLNDPTFDENAYPTESGTKTKVEAILNDAGETIGLTITERHCDGYYANDGYFVEKEGKFVALALYYRHYHTYTYTLYKDASVYIMRSCAGDILYDFMCEYSYKSEDVCFNADGTVNEERSSDYSYTIRTSGIDVLYNAKTGKYVYSGWMDRSHEWVKDEAKSVVPKTCGEEGYDYYVCKDCKEVRVDYYLKTHTPVITYTFKDAEKPNCKDGFSMTMTCADCGVTIATKEFDDHTDAMRMIDFSALGEICAEHAGFLRYFQVCACGEVTTFTWDYDYYVRYDGLARAIYNFLNWNGENYKFEQKDPISFVCPDCGLTVTLASKSDKVNDCRTVDTVSVLFSKADGTELQTVTMVSERATHASKTFVRLAEGSTTCNDGVICYTKCLRCGEILQEEWTSNSHYNGNSSDSVYRSVDLGDGLLLCFEGCACGYNDYGYNLYQNGSRADWYGSNGDVQIYRLPDGSEVYLAVTYGERDENCMCEMTLSVMSGAGEEAKQISAGRVERHWYRYFVSLETPGTTCDEGVYYVNRCVYCGKVAGEGRTTDHRTGVLSLVELPEMGEGVVLIHFGCACGVWDNGYTLYRNGSTVYSQYDEWIDGNYWSRYTFDGNTTLMRFEYGPIDQYCMQEGTLLLRIGYDRETQKWTSEKSVSLGLSANHSLIEYVSLLTEGTTCEEGILVTTKCRRCGKVLNSYRDDWHYNGIYNEVDLGEGATLYFRGCPCGERYNGYEIYQNGAYCIYNTIRIDGNDWKEYVLEGTRVILREELTDPVDCKSDRNLIVRIGYDPEAKTWESEMTIYLRTEDNHDVVRTYELREGSKTCYDGIYAIDTCSVCGKELRRYNTYGHDNKNLKETIELSAYGDTCGAVAYLYECACGASREFYIDSPSDDYQAKYLGYYYTKNGWGIGSEYVYTCAVTDPKPCAFRYAIRFKEVQDADACHWKVVRYYILGCDEDGNATSSSRIVETDTVSTYTMHADYKTTTDEYVAFTDLPCVKKALRRNYCSACGYEDAYYVFTAEHNWSEEAYDEDAGKGRTLHANAGSWCVDCGCGNYSVLGSAGESLESYSVYADCNTLEYVQYIYYRGYSYNTHEVLFDSKTGSIEEETRYYYSYFGTLPESVVNNARVRMESSEGGAYRELQNVLRDYGNMTLSEALDTILQDDEAPFADYEEYLAYIKNLQSDIPWAGESFVLDEAMAEQYGEGYLCLMNVMYLELGVMAAGKVGAFYYTNDAFYAAVRDGLTVRQIAEGMMGQEDPDAEAAKKAEILEILGNTDECYCLVVDFVDGVAYITNFYNCCRGNTYYTTDVSSTCTQYGIGGYVTLCVCCGKVLNESEGRVIKPTGHQWASDEDGYHCTVCGIKNAVGANGKVVLEDCTDYDSDTYVTGYYDPTGRDFQLMISLINKEDHNEQYVLFSDVPMSVTGLGYNGKPIYRYLAEGHYIRFSRSEVLSIAAEEYPDLDLSAYDIRLSFVPMGGDDGNLDYGITFEDPNEI